MTLQSGWTMSTWMENTSMCVSVSVNLDKHDIIHTVTIETGT